MLCVRVCVHMETKAASNPLKDTMPNANNH